MQSTAGHQSPSRPKPRAKLTLSAADRSYLESVDPKRLKLIASTCGPISLHQTTPPPQQQQQQQLQWRLQYVCRATNRRPLAIDIDDDQKADSVPSASTHSVSFSINGPAHSSYFRSSLKLIPFPMPRSTAYPISIDDVFPLQTAGSQRIKLFDQIFDIDSATKLQRERDSLSIKHGNGGNDTIIGHRVAPQRHHLAVAVRDCRRTWAEEEGPPQSANHSARHRWSIRIVKMADTESQTLEMGVFGQMVGDRGTNIMAAFSGINPDGTVSIKKEVGSEVTRSSARAPVHQRSLRVGDSITIELDLFEDPQRESTMRALINGQCVRAQIPLPDDEATYRPFIDWTGDWRFEVHQYAPEKGRILPPSF